MTAVEYVPRWKFAELVDLRDRVKALPVGARRILKGGPMQEPDCVVCEALAQAGPSTGRAFMAVQGYHEVSVFDVAPWVGVDVEQMADWAIDEDVDGSGTGLIYLAMRGALQAERCAVICLLAGWVPPRVRTAMLGGRA